MRPSALLGLRDDYLAYCLDEAAYVWGSYVDNELELASRDPKQIRKSKMGAAIARRSSAMDRLMSDSSNRESTLQKAPARFKDPSSMFSGKGHSS